MLNNVGLVTFHSLYNLGSALQAFALQRTIQSLGCSCSIVDYLRSNQGTPHQMFQVPTNPGSVMHDCLSLSTLRSQIVLRRRFAGFRQRHMALTPKSYRSIEALCEDASAFDAFVTGSDMVWHPAWLAKPYGPVYYLDFAKSARRIAYAPSFGVSEIPAKDRERVAAYLRPFAFLSAREDTGCRLVKDLVGREAPHVLDPTLLQPASEYDKVAIAPARNKPYILLYPMQWSSDLCRMAMIVRERLQLPLVAVVPIYRNPWKFRFADKVVYDAGPSEFLGWLKDAAFVCTNSFHGTAFSIIYRKQFLSSPAATMNTRLLSLLARLGLLDRQMKDIKDLNQGDALLRTIEYASCNERLSLAVEESMQYLRRALS